jgi:hypothetical protein
MPRRFRMVLAVWMLALGFGSAFSGAASSPQAASRQDAISDVTPTRARVPADLPVDHQMQALESHAKYRMILYPGRFGQADLAVTRDDLKALALTLKTSAK